QVGIEAFLCKALAEPLTTASRPLGECGCHCKPREKARTGRARVGAIVWRVAARGIQRGGAAPIGGTLEQPRRLRGRMNGGIGRGAQTERWDDAGPVRELLGGMTSPAACVSCHLFSSHPV